MITLTEYYRSMMSWLYIFPSVNYILRYTNSVEIPCSIIPNTLQIADSSMHRACITGIQLILTYNYLCGVLSSFIPCLAP